MGNTDPSQLDSNSPGAISAVVLFEDLGNKDRQSLTFDLTAGLLAF
ncbi:MAG: hypothetical protein FWG24_06435 [Eggerthellaceae bacterium]|nr:hypothetical protein [Eggerthellaceae bacterium]